MSVQPSSRLFGATDFFIPEERIPVCGVDVDKQRARDGSIARWSTEWDGTKWPGTPKPITLTLSGPENLKENILWAYREWSKVAALFFEWQSQGQANINYTMGRIDGSSGILAWNELPYGPDRPLDGKIDSSERWHMNPLTPPARGTIHLGAVICHEGGHGLGLEHDNSSSVVALMDPVYSSRVLIPQPADIKQIQYRYGEPVTPTTPTDQPEGSVFIEVSQMLSSGRYKLVPVQ